MAKVLYLAAVVCGEIVVVRVCAEGTVKNVPNFAKRVGDDTVTYLYNATVSGKVEYGDLVF